MNEAQIKNATNVKENNNNNNVNHKRPPSSKGKKVGGPKNILRAALQLLQKKKSGQKPTSNPCALNVSNNATLNHIMGSIRPLYLQSEVGDMSPPPPLVNQNAALVEGVLTPSNDTYVTSSSSVSRCSSRTSSSYEGGMSSKYASAQSLCDLDNHDDDNEDGDAYYDLIDAKAELFIANFYQQMRLQN